MKKKPNTVGDTSFYITIYLMLLFIILVLIIPYIMGIPIDSSFYNYCSIILAIIAVLISIKTQVNHDKIISKNNKTQRKVKILKSISPDNIGKEIERLYNDELFEKSIDKIDIVNTSVGQNDNRKDVIVIYH